MEFNNTRKSKFTSKTAFETWDFVLQIAEFFLEKALNSFKKMFGYKSFCSFLSIQLCRL